MKYIERSKKDNYMAHIHKDSHKDDIYNGYKGAHIFDGYMYIRTDIFNGYMHKGQTIIMDKCA